MQDYLNILKKLEEQEQHPLVKEAFREERERVEKLLKGKHPPPHPPQSPQALQPEPPPGDVMSRFVERLRRESQNERWGRIYKGTWRSAQGSWAT